MRLAEFDAEIKAAETRRGDCKSLDAQQAEWEGESPSAADAGEPQGPWVKFALDSDGKGDERRRRRSSKES